MNGKKVLGILIIISVTLGIIAGCSRLGKDEEETDESLIDLTNSLCDGVSNLPQYEAVALDKNNFEYFAFVPYAQGYEAVAADALVNIEAHSLVLIHLNEDNTKELAEKILANANPNKWLCVGAKKVNVAYSSHYIMLVMSSDELTNALTENFKLMCHKLYDGEVTVLSADNNIREFE